MAMRDSGALTELLLTRLKKVEVPKNYVSLRKRLMENKPAREFHLFTKAQRTSRRSKPTKSSVDSAAPIDRAPQFRTFGVGYVLETRWNFEPKNPAECRHGSDIDDAFPAAKCCASVDPGRCTDHVLRRHSQLSLSPLRPTSLSPRSARHPSRRAVFFSRTPGLFGKGRRRLFKSAAGSEPTSFLLTSSKTGPILASLNERRSVGSTTPRIRQLARQCARSAT